MSIKQISILIENKKGQLAETSRYIADHDINMRALSIADTQDYGILRIICDDPEKANAVLREGGYMTMITKVVAVANDDKPGSMADILDVLVGADVAVEYAYAFVSPKAEAYMVFRVDDYDKAVVALTEAGKKVANEADLI